MSKTRWVANSGSRAGCSWQKGCCLADPVGGRVPHGSCSKWEKAQGRRGHSIGAGSWCLPSCLPWCALVPEWEPVSEECLNPVYGIIEAFISSATSSRLLSPTPGSPGHVPSLKPCSDAAPHSRCLNLTAVWSYIQSPLSCQGFLKRAWLASVSSRIPALLLPRSPTW